MEDYKERILKFREELKEDVEKAKYTMVDYDRNGELVVSYHLIMAVLDENFSSSQNQKQINFIKSLFPQ